MIEFNLMDRLLEGTREQFPIIVCYIAVKSRLDDLGIQLSEQGKKRLLDEIYVEISDLQSDEFSLKMLAEYSEGDFLTEPPEGSIESIILTLDDVKIAEEKAIEYSKNTLDELYPELVEELSSKLHHQLMKDAKRVISEQRLERTEFNNLVQEIWEKPLLLLETLFSYSKHICADYTKHLSDKADKNYESLTDALIRLNARGNLVASEIFTLLSNGYADGAMARWRTLYELTVISLFLEKHGEKTAQRFLDYLIIESYKGMKEYNDYSQQLGWDMLPENDLKAAKAEYKTIMKKYGKGFDDYYGWAKIALPNVGRISFNKIQKDVTTGHFLPTYRKGNQEVHASSHSMLFRLGFDEHMTNDNYVLSGRSLFGLDEPGTQSASTLTYLVSIFLNHKNDGDGGIYLKVLLKIVDDITKEFQVAKSILQNRTDIEWDNQ